VSRTGGSTPPRPGHYALVIVSATFLSSPDGESHGELTLVERTRRELRRQLLVGTYPLWERLAEAKLASQLGVSRTPVREALRLLEREDLVTVDDGGSYRPRAPEVGHLRELYAVRVQLEDLSMQLACAPGRNDELLARLAERWRSMEATPESADPAEFVFVEEDFHLTLARVGGNGALVDVLRSINERVRLARMGAYLVEGHLAETTTQHCRILGIVEQRDTQAARAAMSSHISESASLVEQSATDALARLLNLPSGA